tara:strand:+ start:820 stop:1605 length:786 start_codon:yes stop_codon:yes gene_type:complete
MSFFTKKKIAILVISRTKSRRLKNKAKLKIKGLNLIEIIIKRLLSKFDKKSIIICSSNFNNDKFFYKALSKKYDVGTFFGSENNVLKRITDCLEKHKLKHFVRLTGDNPLVDINAIHRLSLKHIKGKFDYTFTDSLPMGMKSEIFSLEALKRNYKKIVDLNSTEYLTYFFRRPDIYKIQKVNFKKLFKNQNQYKISIDKRGEFGLLKKFFLKKKNINFSRTEIIKFLKKNSKVKKVSNKIKFITKKYDVRYESDQNKFFFY